MDKVKCEMENCDAEFDTYSEYAHHLSSVHQLKEVEYKSQM